MPVPGASYRLTIWLDQIVAAIIEVIGVAETVLRGVGVGRWSKLPAFGRESGLSKTPSRPIGGP
jgi:hypothetical protein